MPTHYYHHDLMARYEAAKATTAQALLEERKLEQEIYRCIEELGGTSLPNADANGEQIWVCEQVDTYPSPRYNPSDFTQFLESLNQTELRSVYIPAHEETITVNAQWKTQKLKALAARNGLKFPEAVPTGRKLKFERVQ